MSEKLPYRSQCKCACHEGLKIHVRACCQPDPPALAAHEPAVNVGAVVKALEWKQLYPEQTMFSKDWHGTGILAARYVIQQYRPDGVFYVIGQEYPSFDEAKSAAQADYEHRVLSALTQPQLPDSGESVEGRE